MKDGDVAGISTFIGNYGFIGVKKEKDQYYLIMMGRPAKDTSVFGQFEYENPGMGSNKRYIGFLSAQRLIFSDKKDRIFCIKSRRLAEAWH